MTVGKDARTLRNLGLAAVCRGKLSIRKPRPPPTLESSGNLLVHLHPAAEDAGDRRLGEIVAGGPKTTRRYHGTRSIEGLAHGRGNSVGFVTDGGAANYLGAGSRERARYVRRVRVYGKAEEELVTDGDQLDLQTTHRAKAPEYRRR